MGLPSPPNSPATDAEAYLRSVARAPTNFGGVQAEASQLAERAFAQAVIASPEIVGAAAEADGFTVAAALASFFDLPLVVILFIVLLALRGIEYGIAGLLSFLPWGWGGKWADGIRRVFSPLDNLENATVALLVSAVAGIFRSIAVVVGWGMTQNQGHAANVAVGANAQYLNYLNQRTMALWAWDSRLQADVTTIQRTLSHPSSPPAPTTAPPLPEPTTVIQNTTVTEPIPQNVWDQLSHLESQNALRVQDITAIRDDLSRMEHTVTTLQNEFVQLSQNVHSIRALSVGLQDMQQEIEAVSGLMVSFIDQASVQFEHQAHELTQLAPFHLLLQTGAVGMQVLRQLQDTPCMCPRIPRLPGLTPELLAMYEFVTHG